MPLLQKAKFLTSANHINELPEDDGLEIAFAGRSNAGKSSAINSLMWFAEVINFAFCNKGMII